MSDKLNKKFVKIIQTPTEDLFEFSNLIQADTGLPMVVWVSVKLHSAGARVKVQKDDSTKINPNNTFSVSISDEPRIVAGEYNDNKNLEQLYGWIILNKDVLLQYWNFEISTKEMLEKIKPI
jgi:hypothetical protein